MLNFDEQTGIGVLMIVWSFLLSRPWLAPMKTTTTIIPTSVRSYSFHKQWHPIAPATITLTSLNIQSCKYIHRLKHSISIVTIIFTFMLINTPNRATMSKLLSKTSYYLHQDDASKLLYCMIATWVKSASIDGLECESSYRQGLTLEIFEFISLLFEVILRTSMQALICIARSCDSYCSKVYLPTCFWTYYLAL